MSFGLKMSFECGFTPECLDTKWTLMIDRFLAWNAWWFQDGSFYFRVICFFLSFCWFRTLVNHWKVKERKMLSRHSVMQWSIEMKDVKRSVKKKQGSEGYYKYNDKFWRTFSSIHCAVLLNVASLFCLCVVLLNRSGGHRVSETIWRMNKDIC